MRLLKELCEESGPPGFEDRIRAIYRREVEPLVDRIETDGLGNVIAIKHGRGKSPRKVMVGSRRVPYWQGGRAYQPYAQGYFGGFGPMDWMFMGMLFGGGFDGLGEGIGAIGEGFGDMLGGIGDGIGGMFDGFDF